MSNFSGMKNYVGMEVDFREPSEPYDPDKDKEYYYRRGFVVENVGVDETIDGYIDLDGTILEFSDDNSKFELVSGVFTIVPSGRYSHEVVALARKFLL